MSCIYSFLNYLQTGWTSNSWIKIVLQLLLVLPAKTDGGKTCFPCWCKPVKMFMRTHPILQQAKWTRAYWQEQYLILNLYLIRSVLCFHVFLFALLTFLCVSPSTPNYHQPFHANLFVYNVFTSFEKSSWIGWKNWTAASSRRPIPAFLIFQTLLHLLILDLHHLLLLNSKETKIPD